MSISLEVDALLAGPSLGEKALARLRASGNPFENLAQPNKAPDDFPTLALPELHQPQRELLWEMIDWYRLPSYDDHASLRPTRAVTIVGDRGSGKTHLLQSLFVRPDQKAQLIVRPNHVAQGLSFEEYLLTQIRIALGQKDEFHAETPLEIVARTLARLLLRQALRCTSPLDRVFALTRPEPPSWGLLWGGAERQAKRVDRLLDRLEKEDSSQDLPGLLREAGISAEAASALVGRHLSQMEAGSDPIMIVRRTLYTAMAREVFRGETANLARALREDQVATQSEDKLPRADLVTALLQVLVEACTLVQMPIVVVFDNLERLLHPMGHFDAELCKSFLDSLAHRIDDTRGILFLLFVEAGLFSLNLVPQMDEFARARLEQTIPLPAPKVNQHLVRLFSPTLADIRRLAKSRIDGLLGDFPEREKLPDCFPFEPAFVSGLVGEGSVNLRNVLFALREEFNRIVYPEPLSTPKLSGEQSDPVREQGDTDPIIDGGSDPLEKVETIDWGQHLEKSWRKFLNATRTSGYGDVSHDDLHECLGSLLQALPGLTLRDWTLSRVTPTQSVGENLSYGKVTFLEWRRAEGAVNPGPHLLKVGVGMLFAGARGMELDLRAKFDFFQLGQRSMRLVILWPKEVSGDPVEALPPLTRSTWDGNGQYHRWTALRSITDLDVRRVLCMRSLLNEVEQVAGQQPPPDIVSDFLRERFENFLPQLLPPGSSENE